MKMLLIASLFLSITAHAEQERFEVGASSGTTHSTSGETFKSSATTGNAQNYWLGYGLDKNWGVEAGLDHFDFDGTNTDHQLISLGAVYRFLPELQLHPITKLAVGATESKNFAGDKTSSLGAKFAAGVEVDFKYVSAGVLASYHYLTKAGEADAFKDAQAAIPALFITLHNEIEKNQPSKSVAPVAAAVAPKDADADGIADEDDKCPNTPANTVVNQFGCAEKEKASIKLDVTFASGKTNLDAKYNASIESLANFMKKYPETNVEIAGHTDNVGVKAKNVALSEKRAATVKDALINAGISAHRLTSKGYGDSVPVSDNKTAQGRAENRRVIANITVETDKKK